MTTVNSFFGKTILIVAAIAASGLLQPLARAADQKPDSAAFARGAKAWANNCSRCHNMRDPKDLTDVQWRPVVAHMRVRAGLTGQEARDILLFLQRSN